MKHSVEFPPVEYWSWAKVVMIDGNNYMLTIILSSGISWKLADGDQLLLGCCQFHIMIHSKEGHLPRKKIQQRLPIKSNSSVPENYAVELQPLQLQLGTLST
jgi:hypothetical protein